MTESGGMFSKLMDPHTAKPPAADKPPKPTGAPSSPPPLPLKGKPRKREQYPSQSTDQSTSQSASQLISQSTGRQITKIVDRPKAFYITEGLDEKLDKAVDYLHKKHGIKKVDRSAIVNALLDNETHWTDEALDRLVERVMSQLTSRLISR